MILALLLPKGASRQCHPCVGPLGRDALERLGQLTQGQRGCHQNVNMIRHDYERMQFIMSQHESVVVDCLHDHVRELWLAKGGTDRSGFGRADSGGWEGPIRRQTAVKTPSDENRMFDLIEVRKPTAV